MANPLVRPKSLTTKETNPQEMQQTPIPDSYKPDYLMPGRGAVNHGVEIPRYSGYEPTVSYDDSMELEAVEAYEKPLEPIPVRLVDNAGREMRRFRTSKFNLDVGGIAKRVLGRDSNRSKVTFYNSGSTPVILSDNASSAQYDGFTIPGKSSFSLISEDEIFMVAENTRTVLDTGTRTYVDATPTVDTVNKYRGNDTLSLTSGGVTGQPRTIIALSSLVTPGTTLTLSYKYRPNVTLAATPFVYYYYNNSSGISSSALLPMETPLDNGWIKVECSYVIPSGKLVDRVGVGINNTYTVGDYVSYAEIQLTTNTVNNFIVPAYDLGSVAVSACIEYTQPVPR